MSKLIQTVKRNLGQKCPNDFAHRYLPRCAISQPTFTIPIGAPSSYRGPRLHIHTHSIHLTPTPPLAPPPSQLRIHPKPPFPPPYIHNAPSHTPSCTPPVYRNPLTQTPPNPRSLLTPNNQHTTLYSLSNTLYTHHQDPIIPSSHHDPPLTPQPPKTKNQINISISHSYPINIPSPFTKTVPIFTKANS